VKDFLKDNWKTAAACALGAFLLSLLVGLISRNPFGVVLLRAFFLAILFAGLGVGARLAARTYLPELAGASPGAQPESSDSRGRNVDIVLPEENPQASARTGRHSAGAGMGGGTGDMPADAEAAAEGAALDEESTARQEAHALGELSDELAEELPSASEKAPGPDEDVSELADVADPSPPQRGGRGGPASGGSAEDLDALPDISNLEIAPDEMPGRTAGRGSRRTADGETPRDALRGAVSAQDPATIARAIRTVLKKDEKG
jgi:hypothetical protein